MGEAIEEEGAVVSGSHVLLAVFAVILLVNAGLQVVLARRARAGVQGRPSPAAARYWIARVVLSVVVGLLVLYRALS